MFNAKKKERYNKLKGYIWNNFALCYFAGSFNGFVLRVWYFILNINNFVNEYSDSSLLIDLQEKQVKFKDIYFYVDIKHCIYY